MCKIPLTKYESCGHLLSASEIRRCKKAKAEDLKFKECKNPALMFSRKRGKCEDCDASGRQIRREKEVLTRTSDATSSLRMASENLRDRTKVAGG
ncbi:hypothetical protein ACEPPN_013250 [Leptodophora sp. 'Broadleaf-Isolate-01']